MESLSESADAVGKIRRGVSAIAHIKKLKANLFLSRQLDPEDFNLMDFDWSLFGINPEEVKFRLNAPRGQHEKTVEKIESVSILIDRCCILKIPMRSEAPLELTEVEKNLRKKLQNKELYLSCDFNLMN